MCPIVRYPMLKSLLSPFRRSQPKTLGRVMAAAASVAQASSLAVAGHPAARPGIQPGSALNVGRRAIPVQVAAFRKTPIFRSQNGWEPTFLRLLVHTLREVGRTAVLPCDRGFHRVSGFQLLPELKPSFVVRRVAGSSTPGRRSTSGRTRPSGSSGSGPQGRRNPGRPDPLADLVALYDRRMGLGIPRAAASA